MKSLSDPIYPAALAWFERNGWSIEYEINHATKKMPLSLCLNGKVIKTKTINYDINLVSQIQQSIINLYKHFNGKER